MDEKQPDDPNEGATDLAHTPRPDVYSPGPIPVQNEREVDPRAVAMAVIDKIRWEHEGRCEKGRLYPFAFKIGESRICKLVQRVESKIDTLELYPDAPLMFSAEVRHQDLSSLRFDSLQDLVERAGNKNDPERLSLRWQQSLASPAGTFIRVEITFTTEKPLQIKELGLLSFSVASMELRVVGPDPSIVSGVFEEITPFLETSRIRGIYRPLLLFRNRNFVHLIGWSFGLLGWTLYNELVRELRRPDRNAARQSLVDRIAGHLTIDDKFVAFIAEIYGPHEADSILQAIVTTAFGFVVWIMVATVGFFLLPKLVPRSGINIGLAGGRYEEYENVLRLVVFTILLSGLILPLVRMLLF